MKNDGRGFTAEPRSRAEKQASGLENPLRYFYSPIPLRILRVLGGEILEYHFVSLGAAGG